jgi:hypothetical protein
MDCTKECTGSDITHNEDKRLASVNNLSAYTYYQFKVFAKNGVTKLAEKNNETANYTNLVLRTEETSKTNVTCNILPFSSTCTDKKLFF